MRLFSIQTVEGDSLVVMAPTADDALALIYNSGYGYEIEDAEVVEAPLYSASSGCEGCAVVEVKAPPKPRKPAMCSFKVWK